MEIPHSLNLSLESVKSFKILETLQYVLCGAISLDISYDKNMGLPALSKVPDNFPSVTERCGHLKIL